MDIISVYETCDYSIKDVDEDWNIMVHVENVK